ncbi:MAG TPA: alpha/beta hydrolase [Thermoleophilaceae bacterium]|nr:alpha/beta hydrolase [Thermoleophilaceae bacterium]
MEARHDEGRFAGAGALEIYWQAWLPDGEPRAIVLLAHGGAEHSGRYAWTAGELVARGFAVYAVDHRGHGRSEGPRAYVDRMAHAVADLHSLSEIAAERHPTVPRFLLGHSMGGLIALEYALLHQDELTGLVLSAPLAVLDANPVARGAARALSAVAPRLPIYRIDATTVSRDPEVVRAYERDPLNHRGLLPARTIGELMAATAALPARLPDLRLPILSLYGTGDRLVSTAGSAVVEAGCGSGDCTVRGYDGLYHELLNEPERERVLADIVDWVEARLAVTAPQSQGGVHLPKVP